MARINRLLLSGSLASLLAMTVVGCGSQSQQAKPSAGTGGAAGTPGSAAVPNVSLTGPSTVHLGESPKFSASVTNSSGESVRWQINGIDAGSATAGTIDSKGLYTPPNSVPENNAITVSAVLGSTQITGSMTVTLLQPIPSIVSQNLVSTDGGNTATLTVQASGLNDTPVLLVANSQVPTQRSSTQLLTATIPVTSAGVPVSVAIQNTGSGSQVSTAQKVALQINKATARAAARLLSQSTFGPNAQLIQQVQSEGLSAYVDEQMAKPSSTFDTINALLPLPAYCGGNANYCLWYSWWQHAMVGDDQLRQRVAFALSEMFVVSGNGANIQGFPTFLNYLSNDSFGNWRDLMGHVTRSVAMGQYLNMLNSSKPGTGQIANENYGREMLQLFSLGINQLNIDGSLELDPTGHPIPNYSAAQIQAFARAFTGWTYPAADGSAVRSWPASAYYVGLMRPYDAAHDQGEKHLLGGTVLAQGQTAQQDLDGALDNIFQQPSLPPFVCKQLIQHLVTSNPSPEYVARVAKTFVDNGSGVRGDMNAVVRAILLDSEARALDDPNAAMPNFGHLQEPVLWLAASLRGLQASPTVNDASAYNQLTWLASLINQPLLSAPSVFNFFSPATALPGSELVAPEFGIENTASLVARLSVADKIITPGQIGNLSIDLSSTGALGKLAASDPAQLVGQLNTIFLHGSMSEQMSETILSAISSTSDPAQRVRLAVYLVITSSQFKISR